MKRKNNKALVCIILLLFGLLLYEHHRKPEGKLGNIITNLFLLADRKGCVTINDMKIGKRTEDFTLCKTKRI